jgi:hypothetical protein
MSKKKESPLHKPIKHKNITDYILNKNEISTCNWYKHQINENLVLEDKEFEKKLKSMPPEHWKYGWVLRHNTMRAMTLNLFMSTTTTIVVVFKIKDATHDDREVIYNITYVNVKPSSKRDVFFDNISVPDSEAESSSRGNLYVNGICPTGSTISKDGEYRSIILYWKYVKFYLAKHPKLGALFRDIITYLTDKFQDRRLLIYAHYYFPTDKMRQRYSFELELIIANRKIEYFAVSWFLFYYANAVQIIPDHLNQLYQKIMFKYKHEDAAFFDSLIKKHTIDIVRTMLHLFSSTARSTTDRGNCEFCKIKMGQKLIPISLREIQYPFDITYKPWKEYFINLRLTDLVVNNITPGFPITTNWLFIKNTDQHVFDNPMQYTRMEKSAHAMRITDILAQARFLAGQHIKPSQILLQDEDSSMEFRMGKRDKRMVTSWLSKEFQMLHDGIDDDIKNAQLNIIMSNVAFCIFSEFVGRTLYESIFITKKSPYYRSLVSNMFSEAGYTNFERYMFEIAYNLYCAVSKFGIIHGDLHLHNITINDIFYKMWTNVSIKDPKVLYCLDPGVEFVFDTNFYYMTVIDFSRSILDPTRVNIFRHEHLHKTFDLVDDAKLFEKQQIDSLIEYLYSCKPEYKEKGVLLYNGLITHFSIFFKILSVLDLYMIMLRLSDFLQMRNEHHFTLYEGSINLVKQIFAECDLFLTNALEEVLLGDSSIEDKYLNAEWPTLTIIKKIFKHRMLGVTEIDAEQIIDVYNYNNDITYTLNYKERFPPPFADLKKHKDNDAFVRNSLVRRAIYEEESADNYKTLLIIKKRQREKNVH